MTLIWEFAVNHFAVQKTSKIRSISVHFGAMRETVTEDGDI